MTVAINMNETALSTHETGPEQSIPSTPAPTSIIIGTTDVSTITGPVIGSPNLPVAPLQNENIGLPKLPESRSLFTP